MTGIAKLLKRVWTSIKILILDILLWVGAVVSAILFIPVIIWVAIMGLLWLTIDWFNDCVTDAYIEELEDNYKQMKKYYDAND